MVVYVLRDSSKKAFPIVTCFFLLMFEYFILTILISLRIYYVSRKFIFIKQ